MRKTLHWTFLRGKKKLVALSPESRFDKKTSIPYYKIEIYNYKKVLTRKKIQYINTLFWLKTGSDKK